MTFLGLTSVIGVPVQTVTAKEVDEFTDRLMLIDRLEDGTDEIDQQVNLRIGEMIRELNRSGARVPVAQREIIRNAFQAKMFAGIRSPMEEWVDQKSHVHNFRVLYRGIYGGAVNFDDMGLGWYVDLSPTIKVNQVLIGVDKIGHFFGQGWDYFARYNLLHDSHPPRTDAETVSIFDRIRALGNQFESTMLGSVGTGVYSYADLAANWQGFVFYRNLLEGDSPYVTSDGKGLYIQARQFTFKDYVTDEFDEVINPSALQTGRFYSHVRDNLLSTQNSAERSICQDYLDDPVRFMHLTSARHLPRREFLDIGGDEGRAPLAYTLKIGEICD